MMAILSSKLLIPVVILIIAAAVSIFVIYMSNQKKKNKKEELHVYSDNINTTASVLPVVPTNEVTPQVEVKQEEVINTPPPTIDIPVPEVNDTPITIEEQKPLVNENTNEQIIVDKTNPLEESNVSQDEIVHVQIAKELTNEVDDSITIDEPTPLTNEVGEKFIVEEAKPITNDIGETAFKSIPSNNTTINTDIKIEDHHEYEGNKTEIFNLEEIKAEMKKQDENKREQL